MSKKQKETPILADEALGKSEAFIIKNKKPITTILLIIIVAVVAYMGYKNYVLEPKEAEANKAFAHFRF